MARLRERITHPTTGVPAALLDHHHRVWRDPVLFEEWMRHHAPGGIGPDGRPRGVPVTDPLWYHRFHAGVDAWAVANGLRTGSGRWPAHTDWRRLAELGIARVHPLERARARSEASLLPGQHNYRNGMNDGI